jgi:hypothetical protein
MPSTPVTTALSRFTAGLSTVAQSDPLGGLTIPDTTKWSVWLEDFNMYDVAQGAAYWTLTATNGVDTITGPNGVLVLTLGGADNDLAQLQLVEAPHAFVAGKKMIVETRLKVTKAGGTIGQDELYIGLATIATGTNFVAADGLSLAANDGVLFAAYDGSATIQGVSRVSDVESNDSNVGTLVSAVWTTLTIYYDGTAIYFYQDGVQTGSVTSVPPTAILSPTIYFKAGEAQADVLSVDYLGVWSER